MMRRIKLKSIDLPVDNSKAEIEKEVELGIFTSEKFVVDEPLDSDDAKNYPVGFNPLRPHERKRPHQTKHICYSCRKEFAIKTTTINYRQLVTFCNHECFMNYIRLIKWKDPGKTRRRNI